MLWEQNIELQSICYSCEDIGLMCQFLPIQDLKKSKGLAKRGLLQLLMELAFVLDDDKTEKIKVKVILRAYHRSKTRGIGYF